MEFTCRNWGQQKERKYTGPEVGMCLKNNSRSVWLRESAKVRSSSKGGVTVMDQRRPCRPLKVFGSTRELKCIHL